MKQEIQNYWNLHPCNSTYSELTIGTHEYFLEIERNRYRREPHIPKFTEFPLWRGKRVLEIGCGIGVETINFARAGARVTSVDMSSTSVELAQKFAEHEGLLDKINFYNGDAENLSSFLPPQRFDLIFSHGVIHHTIDQKRVIREIAKFSHNYTRVKIMLYNLISFVTLYFMLRHPRDLITFKSIQKLISKHSELYDGCPLTRAYTKRTAKELLYPEFIIDDIKIAHITSKTKLLNPLQSVIGWNLLIDAHSSP
jgi:2-polyprenyl-3-methyl-5-hydroxy-6-metoxy-1,4-benzoquinol methylase